MSDGVPDIDGVPSIAPVLVASTLHAFGFLFGTRLVHDATSAVPCIDTCPLPVSDPSGAVLTFMLTVPENCIDEQRQVYSP